jgi:hypothetical protein
MPTTNPLLLASQHYVQNLQPRNNNWPCSPLHRQQYPHLQRHHHQHPPTNATIAVEADVEAGVEDMDTEEDATTMPHQLYLRQCSLPASHQPQPQPALGAGATRHPTPTSGTTTTTIASRAGTMFPFGTPAQLAMSANAITRRDAPVRMWRSMRQPATLALAVASTKQSCPPTQLQDRLDRKGRRK